MSSLLSLPAELRNAIYEYALSDLRTAPRTPHTIFKTDFTTYNSLQRANRQLEAESKYILSQYAPYLTIYVNDVPQHYAILAASQSNTPALSTARFRLSISTIPQRPPKPHWVAVIAAFIALQHGWSRRHIESFQSYDRTDPEDSPAYLQWQALDDDRTFGIGPVIDGREKQVFPEFGNGLSYTRYVQMPRLSNWEGAVVIIEGRLGDLVMDEEENLEWMRGN